MSGQSLDQSNLSVQRSRLIFWVECSVGGYLPLAKTIGIIPKVLKLVFLEFQAPYFFILRKKFVNVRIGS
jgi:hypothetical protein